MLCCILQFSLISQHLFILLHIQSDAWPMVLCALAKVATFILFFAIFTKYLYKSCSDYARLYTDNGVAKRALLPPEARPQYFYVRSWMLLVFINIITPPVRHLFIILRTKVH